MSKWIFGVDGGGTTSRIRIESMEGEKLFEKKGGSTNPNSNSKEIVLSTIAILFREAFNSGLDPNDCLSGYVSSAGVDRPDDKVLMNEIVSDAFCSMARGCGTNLNTIPKFGSGNDAESALVGALGCSEGYLLIAGTGSIALARALDGTSSRAGGWGHFLGDEGSAFWIAFEGIKAGIRAYEGRDEKSSLISEAVKFFNLPNEQALIPFVYSHFNKAHIASFAPTVIVLAQKGDLAAKSIIDKASIELYKLVESVYKIKKDIIKNKKIALYGGLLDFNECIKSSLISILRSNIPELEIQDAIGDAQVGACKLARALI